MASSPSLACGERKHWWLSNRKIVEKYVKDARAMIGSQDESEMGTGLNLIEAALSLSPRYEPALELKARTLLYLRRFKEVANMLQEHIPSYKMSSEEPNLSSELNASSRERVKLLSDDHNSLSESPEQTTSFKCFSVSDLKKKVMAGLCKQCEKEGQWRYLVLGEACCHLGLMEDAMVLLQTGKRLSSAAFRRESICWSDDSFTFSSLSNDMKTTTNNLTTPLPLSEPERVSQFLAHIKLLLRRRTAALAALDAGVHSEAIRHFSKILENRRGTPQGFLAECYLHRASAYRAAGRIAESIADCNRTLALEPTCIPALSTRANLLETIRCLPDCLRDLEHLKLLYDSVIRDRKVPGPAWKRNYIRGMDMSSSLRTLTAKIQEVRQRVGLGEIGNVDYYALIGLRRGCSRSELERAHLLLCLRHRPDKATNFIDRCEFVDDRDLDTVKDQARMSALLLYRLLQKGYSSVMGTIMDEESVEKQRQKTAAALQAAAAIQVPPPEEIQENNKPLTNTSNYNLNNIELQEKRNVAAAAIQVPTLEEIQENNKPLTNTSNYNYNLNNIELQEKRNATAAASVIQGVFCRDIAVVGNLLSQVGFNRQMPLKYEALSC